jgi:hypothetical protein
VFMLRGYGNQKKWGGKRWLRVKTLRVLILLFTQKIKAEYAQQGLLMVHMSHSGSWCDPRHSRVAAIKLQQGARRLMRSSTPEEGLRVLPQAAQKPRRPRNDRAVAAAADTSAASVAGR